MRTDQEVSYKTGRRFSPDTESVGNLILDLACRHWEIRINCLSHQSIIVWASQVALVVKNQLASSGDVRWGCHPRVGKIPWWQPTSILAWRIPWAEQPSWLQSIGSQKVRHIWSSLARKHTMIVYYSSLSRLRHKWGHGIWNLRTKGKWFETLNFTNIYIHPI